MADTFFLFSQYVGVQKLDQDHKNH
jgi:hypothetical protein